MRTSDHTLYYERRRKRRRRNLRMAVAAVFILVLAAVITFIIGLFTDEPEVPAPIDTEIRPTVLAPLPMQVELDKEVWSVTGPAIQTGDYTIRTVDYDLLALPECGDRKSTRLNSSHVRTSRMPSSA